MTHDYYSGVLSHYRPLGCNAPHCALHPDFGQANERGAVPELAGPRAKLNGYLGVYAHTRMQYKYHPHHQSQTAIVAILAG